MFNRIIWLIKKVFIKLLNEEKSDDTYAYRDYLFKELIESYGKEYFNQKRILEIGPKDGEDTFRLEDLNPSELVLVDLADKEEENNKWINKLKCNFKFIEGNFLYFSQKEYEELGKFDLIYFTGVLYHNPEQLRFLQKLYEKLNFGGVLVLESATTRNKKLIKENAVEVLFPETYRNTTTVSHLPSKKAIVSWLNMVGFEKINISKCYEKEDYNVKDVRFACIAEKEESNKASTYYAKQLKEDSFVIGKST